MWNGCLEPAFERRDLAMAITRITTGENSPPQARSGIGDVVNSSRSVEVARKSVTEGTEQIPVILYVV